MNTPSDKETQALVRYFERRIYSAIILSGVIAEGNHKNSEEIIVEYAIRLADRMLRILDATEGLPTGSR